MLSLTNTKLCSQYVDQFLEQQDQFSTECVKSQMMIIICHFSDPNFNKGNLAKNVTVEQNDHEIQAVPYGCCFFGL